MSNLILLQDPATLITLIVLHLLTFLLSTLCNALVCSFYRHKHTHITHFLYLVLGCADAAFALTSLLHAALLLLLCCTAWEEGTAVRVLLPAVYILTALASRISGGEGAWEM